jgi:diacylglycerol O-acyltransferase
MPQGEPISPADSAWLRMDAPDNPMVITGLFTFAEPLAPAELAAFVEARLLPFERFRQRLAPQKHGRRPRWELDPDFQLRAHVHHLALPRPGSDAELAEVVSDAMSAPLDMRTPLWHMHLLDGYAGGCALLFRVHHALADGLALVHLLEAMGATGRPPAQARGTGSLETVSQGFARALHEIAAHPSAARDALERGAQEARAAGRLLALPRERVTSLKGALGTEKRAACTGPIDLAALRSVAHRDDAKVSDVFATLVAGGLRRYLCARGEATDGLELRAVVPVNLRHDDGAQALGNQFGLMFLGLPVGIASPRQRLLEIVGRTRALKESGEAAVTYAILESMAFAPDALDDLVVDVFEAKATLVMTSVVGPTETAIFAGHPVRSMAFWAPQAGRLGLGVSILSYAGEVRIGVASDAKLVAEPREIASGIEAELSVLLAEGGAPRDAAARVAPAGRRGRDDGRRGPALKPAACSRRSPR